MQTAPDETICFEDCTLDLARCVLVRGGKTIEMKIPIVSSNAAARRRR